MKYFQATKILNDNDLDKERIFNKDYTHLEWKKRRNTILERDHYTCQKCGVTNPSLGIIFHIVDLDTPYFNGAECIVDTIAVHSYNRGSGEYIIDIDDIHITIPFGIHKIVMPILQVHHKKYIQNRMLWEYEDNDLITLCESCHRKEHYENKIPIYNSNNVDVISFTETIYTDLNKFDPVYEFRNFEPWTFVHKDETGKYIYSDKINSPETLILYIGDNDNDYVKEKVSKIFYDFINDFFTNYKIIYTP